MSSFVLHFRRYTGEVIDQECADDFTISLINELLAELLGKDRHAVYIAFNGVVLDPSKTLREVGITHETELELREMDVQFLRANIPSQAQMKILEMKEQVLNYYPEFLIPTPLLHVHMKPVGSDVQGTFIIDTGAMKSILDIGYARRAGLEQYIDLQEQSMLVGVGKRESIGVLWIADFLLNDANNNKIALSASFTVSQLHNLDGIIGLDLLQRWRASIDCSSQTVTFGGSENIRIKCLNLSQLQKEHRI